MQSTFCSSSNLVPIGLHSVSIYFVNCINAKTLGKTRM